MGKEKVGIESIYLVENEAGEPWAINAFGSDGFGVDNEDPCTFTDAGAGEWVQQQVGGNVVEFRRVTPSKWHDAETRPNEHDDILIETIWATIRSGNYCTRDDGGAWVMGDGNHVDWTNVKRWMLKSDVLGGGL